MTEPRVSVDAMSNFSIVVEACSEESLLLALRLVLKNQAWFESWRSHLGVLELYWSVPAPKSGEAGSVNRFMAPMNADEVLPSVVGWLKKQPQPAGPAPDCDGSTSRGFRLEANNHDGWSYLACKIKPIWAIHGK